MGELLTETIGRIGTLVVWDGTDFYTATCNAAGQIEVSVIGSTLPAGAATAANQATVIAALERIDDLQAALNSVGTDELRVLVGHNGGAWGTLTIDAAGHLQVDILTSALPTGAATSANQTTMITALQLIDDLRNALDSVGTDELRTLAGYTGAAWLPLTVDAAGHAQVDVLSSALPTGAATQGTLQNIDGHTKNQVFGSSTPYQERVVNLSAGAGSNALNGSVVPADELWVVTTMVAYNVNTDPSEIYLGLNDGATNHLVERVLAPGVDTPVVWSGHMYMQQGDRAKAYFGGCTANDDLYAFFQGYKMEV